jgi:hypothetical protein
MGYLEIGVILYLAALVVLARKNFTKVSNAMRGYNTEKSLK